MQKSTEQENIDNVHTVASVINKVGIKIKTAVPGHNQDGYLPISRDI